MVEVAEDLDELQAKKEVIRLLSDRWHRLNNLYLIQNESGEIVTFKLNLVQTMLEKYLWWLNIILKSRQHGITTWACIRALDMALWEPGSRCGIIAHTEKDAEKFFRQKILYAYDNIAPEVKQILPKVTRRDMSGVLEFANGSGIEVAVSHRGGTFQFLHISEYGPMCAMYPARAAEVKAGALNTVHEGSIVTIESTAMGREGDFFDRCERAMQLQEKVLGGTADLTRMDYKFFFFAWFHDPKNALHEYVPISDAENKYFDQVEKIMRVKINDAQRAWYIKKAEDQQEKMKQEHPSCLTSDALISTNKGIMSIAQAVPDLITESGVITACGPQPISPIYRIETKAGRILRGTFDHPVHTPSGDFVWLGRLKRGDLISLRCPIFSYSPYIYSWETLGGLNHSIEITEEWGRFAGYFMGDGSWYKGVLSIVCDPQDIDVIEDVKKTITSLFGEPQYRHVGKVQGRRGTIELRKGIKEVQELFDRLQLIASVNEGRYRRRVHVPACIFRSPKPVIKQFLSALFESDGSSMTGRQQGIVRLGTSKIKFAREVQLLLLGFGITSSIQHYRKKAGNRKEYDTYLLCLNTASSIRFHQEIGFIGGRKSSLVPRSKTISKIALEDTVQSVVDEELEDVTYNLSVAKDNIFSANGILTHNTPDEAFTGTQEGVYYAAELSEARTEGRILNIPIVKTLPVNTYWDLGRNDRNGIWFHQRVNKEERMIAYYENSQRNIQHYAKYLHDFAHQHGIIYGKHYLPHDAAVVELTQVENKSRKEVLEDLNIKPIEIVPRIEVLAEGIDMLRNVFPLLYFDEVRCKEGLAWLAKYKRRWNKVLQTFQDEPAKTDARNAADALRQFAQMEQGDKPKPRRRRKPRSWKTA